MVNFFLIESKIKREISPAERLVDWAGLYPYG
jgi:hypothetical protein